MNTKGKQMDALLHQLLRSSAVRFPSKEAIVHGNRRMTYAETWRALTSLASRLKSALGRGAKGLITTKAGLAGLSEVLKRIPSLVLVLAK